MKLRKLLLKLKWFLIVGFVAILSLAWYYGFIPIASGKEKAGIRHALNLNILPSSVQINASGSESSTDYLFEADFNIDPEQFDRLLSGRKYEKHTDLNLGQKFTHATFIKNYKGFAVDTMWSWSSIPPDERALGSHSSQCNIYANKARDRVFIVFTSD